jgi:hypothetical protein
MYLDEATAVKIPTKRTALQVTEMEPSPRKKFRRESACLWRESCGSVDDLYDAGLPTLEEASLLFGFSQGVGA